MPDFTYQTPWSGELDFHRDRGDSRACVMFLRYYGCSTCQLEMRELRRQSADFGRLGVKLYVVLQSQPDTLRSATPEDWFPYQIICDPDQVLYHKFSIGSNPSPDQMSPRLLHRVQQARSEGIVHGKFEGNEAQSPATFLLDEAGVIRYAWYGVESSDVPTSAELLGLVGRTFSPHAPEPDASDKEV